MTLSGFLVIFFFPQSIYGRDVTELFTKQLCFIRNHKVVQYLVNCFSDNQTIVAFWKQDMGVTSSWRTHSQVAESFRIGTSTVRRVSHFTMIRSRKMKYIIKSFQLLEENHTFERSCCIKSGLPGCCCSSDSNT